jgi:ACR3 family arsenite efflux pump ArsB
MQKSWFRRTGPLLLPSTAVGWILSLATLFFSVQIFRMVDRHSHSVSDTLIGAAPVIAMLLVLLGLVAHLSSNHR